MGKVNVLVGTLAIGTFCRCQASCLLRMQRASQSPLRRTSPHFSREMPGLSPQGWHGAHVPRDI